MQALHLRRIDYTNVVKKGWEISFLQIVPSSMAGLEDVANDPSSHPIRALVARYQVRLRASPRLQCCRPVGMP